jgi:MoaA/NifB/PqqE/SkfB family radical SAM enzyme
MIKPKIYIPTFDTEYYNIPINLDIGNRCPLQCPACYRQTQEYDRHSFNDMSVEDLQKFVDSKFTHIEFSGQQSDPMAHPNILEFISICYNKKLTIHTAASHRKKDFYEEAFNRCGMCTSWIFGLDGLPEESHKYRINQNGVHLYEMMKLGVSMGVDIKWQYIVFKYNQDHIEQAQKMAEDEGIEFQLALSDRWNNNELIKFKPREEYCA